MLRSLKYSVIDAMLFAVMVAFGESNFVSYMVLLGFSDLFIGLLTSLPRFLSSMVQFYSRHLDNILRKRSAFIALGAFLQALTFIPLVFLVKYPSFWLALITFSAYFLFGNIISPIWNSLIADWTIKINRNDFFAKRNAASTTLSFVSLAGAFIIFTVFQEHLVIAFVILFAICFIVRGISAFYLYAMKDPGDVPHKKDVMPVRVFLRKAWKSNYMYFTFFYALFMFSVYVSAPFFIPYYIKTLGLSFAQVIALALVTLASKTFFFKILSNELESFGSRKVVVLSAFLIVFCSFPAIWIHTFWGFFLFNIFVGAAWAGFELSTFTYLLNITEDSTRTRASGYFNALFGFGVLGGGIVGGLLLNTPSVTHLFEVSYDSVFIISSLFRLSMVLVFMWFIREVEIKRPISYQDLLVETFFIRPRDSIRTSVYHVEHFISEVPHATKNSFDHLVKGVAESVDYGRKGFVKSISEINEMIEHDMLLRKKNENGKKKET